MSFSSDLDRSCNPGQDTLHRNRRNCVSTSQEALRDSLKSILHAGYSRLNRFIGDYSSAFRKEDGRNEDWNNPILPGEHLKKKKTGFIIHDARPFIPRMTCISLSKRENNRVRIYLISLKILFIFRYFSCICV